MQFSFFWWIRNTSISFFITVGIINTGISYWGLHVQQKGTQTICGDSKPLMHRERGHHCWRRGRPAAPKQPAASSPAPWLAGFCESFIYNVSNWKTSDFVSFQIFPFLCGVLPVWAIWCLSNASNPESWKPARATLQFLSSHRVHSPGACAAENFLLEEIKVDLFTLKCF